MTVLHADADAFDRLSGGTEGMFDVIVPWQTGAGAVHCPMPAHRTVSALLSTKPSSQWKLQLVLCWNGLEDGEQATLPWAGLSRGSQVTAERRRSRAETG